MATRPQTPVKDKNFDLISVLQASLHYVWQLDEYAQDAERAGDEELATWFRKIQHNNDKAAEQGKAMLARRLAER
ncbi:hypothetical protein ABZ863_25445 [Saccharomonospora sp. NPDC046836]|uniref:hypothetical protein n=1 Tax=Saccharomonospora sp. NPDC046836 TaxID=3156921 RepID=UPI0033F261D1